MRSSVLAAIALMAAITAADAVDLKGRIKAIDVAKGTITLGDGMTFVLSKSINPSELKVGEKVKVTYEVTAKRNMASRVISAN